MEAMCAKTGHFCSESDYCHAHDPRFPNCDPPDEGIATGIEEKMVKEAEEKAKKEEAVEEAPPCAECQVRYEQAMKDKKEAEEKAQKEAKEKDKKEAEEEKGKKPTFEFTDTGGNVIRVEGRPPNAQCFVAGLGHVGAWTLFDPATGNYEAGGGTGTVPPSRREALAAYLEAGEKAKKEEEKKEENTEAEEKPREDAEEKARKEAEEKAKKMENAETEEKTKKKEAEEKKEAVEKAKLRATNAGEVQGLEWGLGWLGLGWLRKESLEQAAASAADHAEAKAETADDHASAERAKGLAAHKAAVAAAARNVTFRNVGDVELSLYWVNPGDRTESFVGKLAPGGHLRMGSYEWHTVVARNASAIIGRMTVAQGQSDITFEINGPAQAAARKLADVINRGVPVDVAETLDAETLELALGRIVETSHGWSARVESFLELLEYREPPRVTEREAKSLSTDAWDMPMLLAREGGGVSNQEAGITAQLSFKALVRDRGDTLVQPSYGVSVPLNVDVVPKTADGKWNHKHLSNNKPAAYGGCGACEMPLRSFVETALKEPFHLDTPSLDKRNIVLQTQALGPDKLNFEKVLPHMFIPSQTLWQKHYESCENPPAVGVAGSGRGLLFHAHAAGYNEAVIGRKIWALYPPRNDATGQVTRLDCPWPPWNKTEGHVEEALSAFYDGVAPKSSREGMRSCRDLSMTALQWLVYEMPKLPLEQRPLLFLHEPGELLWLPESWQHLTVQLDDSFYFYSPSCAQHTQATPLAARTAKAMEAMCAKTGHFCSESDYCHAHDPRFPNCDPPDEKRVRGREALSEKRILSDGHLEL
jgi:hypothetical protein